VAIDSTCATFAEVRKRGDEFWDEFEFYLSDLLVGLVMDVVLVGLMAPTAVLSRSRPAATSGAASHTATSHTALNAPSAHSAPHTPALLCEQPKLPALPTLPTPHAASHRRCHSYDASACMCGKPLLTERRSRVA
jgi:Protein RETICULATA-related